MKILSTVHIILFGLAFISYYDFSAIYSRVFGSAEEELAEQFDQGENPVPALSIEDYTDYSPEFRHCIQYLIDDRLDPCRMPNILGNISALSEQDAISRILNIRKRRYGLTPQSLTFVQLKGAFIAQCRQDKNAQKEQ
jgi:hypothetical protein